MVRVRTHFRLWRATRFWAPAAASYGLALAVRAVTGSWEAAFLALVAGGAATVLLHPRLERRARRRLLLRRNAQLNAAADPRAVYDDIAEGYRLLGAPPDPYLQMIDAYTLLQAHRWSEGRARLEAMDRAGLSAPANLAAWENNLAWAMAHDGAAEEAIALADKARERAGALGLPASTRALFDGTWGAALTLAGRHTAALAPLERALEAGGRADAQAARHHYLGRALWALQRPDEARGHWQEAVRVGPKTRWAELAAARLSDPAPPAYR